MAVDQDRQALYQACERLGNVIGIISGMGDGELAEARTLIALVYGGEETPDIGDVIVAIGNATGMLMDITESLVSAKETLSNVAERYGR